MIVASRGSSRSDEAVLRIGEDGTIDLSPALAPVGPGAYTADLFRWSDQGETESAAISGVLSWRSMVAEWKPNSAVPPGLYKLVLTNGSGGLRSSYAIVILQRDPEYRTFSLAFAQFTMSIGSREVEDTADLRRLRIGFLIALWHNPALADQLP